MEEGEKVDYTVPLELNCIGVVQLNTTNGLEKRIINYRCSVMWEDIVYIEEYVRYYDLPKHDGKMLTIIKLKSGECPIVKVAYDAARDDWHYYQVWKKSNVTLLFSKN